MKVKISWFPVGHSWNNWNDPLSNKGIGERPWPPMDESRMTLEDIINKQDLINYIVYDRQLE